jgi:hypothetical protein
MGDRKLNYLTPKIAPQRSCKYCTFDIEANNWTDFEMMGFYDGTIYRQYNTIKEFMESVLVKKYRGWRFYAHFGGKYDFQFVLDYIQQNCPDSFSYKIVNQGSKAIMVQLKSSNRHTWTLVDSSAMFPMASLDMLTKSFDTGAKKLKGTINFKAGERVNKNNPRHQKYLEHDCISLYQVIENFLKIPIIAKEGLNLTVASQAMNTWRHTLKGTIKINPKKIDAFVRDSYCGGRVEIFKFEGSGLNYYDVNSLYPYSMRYNRMPTEYKCQVDDITDDLAFYDVTIQSPGMYIPLLPLKYDGKLIFPNGTFRGTFFSEELKLALDNGYKIVKFHEGHAFNHSDTLFNEYIDTLYDIKNNAPKGSAEELVAKYLLNSLYGKYGQREERQTIKTYAGERENFKWLKDPSIPLIVVNKHFKAPYMLPHIAAAVTSFARMHMAQTIYLKNQTACFYTDTDSILSQTKMRTGSELGELKLESKKVRKGAKIYWDDDLDRYVGQQTFRNVPMEDCDGFFARPKGYEISKDGISVERKMKGFPRDFIGAMTSEEFQRLDFEYKNEVFAPFRRSLISNHRFKSMIPIKKRIISQYSKRRMLGNETEPWDMRGTLIANI